MFSGQTPKSDIPPNTAPKLVTPEDYLQIWDSSATLTGQLAIVMLFGAKIGGVPLSGLYPIFLPPNDATAAAMVGSVDV